jgi:diacylglycerol kinase (ATP)
MTKIAVVAHNKKQLGEGLNALRALLAAEGITDPLWYEVPKSKFAPKAALKAKDKGAELVLVWGGDGTVQRCIDALAGSGVEIGIMPAGTANLLANNLTVPIDLEGALRVALHGPRRKLDVGLINGERFAVMAGTGLDALMIKDADRGLKDRFGRAAYVWTGARHVRNGLTPTRIKINGEKWFDGEASCVLVANVSDVSGGITAFDHAEPDDGQLDVAVVTADGVWQWARTFTRAAFGQTDKSPLVQMSKAHTIDVRLGKKLPYELDGGARPKTDRLKIKIEPAAIAIAVPQVTLAPA